jgi:hypothetical protein
MPYFGPIAIRDALLVEIKQKVHDVNALPEHHPIRRRLARPGRSVVTLNSFAAHALEWLLETLHNNPSSWDPRQRDWHAANQGGSKDKPEMQPSTKGEST